LFPEGGSEGVIYDLLVVTEFIEHEQYSFHCFDLPRAHEISLTGDRVDDAQPFEVAICFLCRVSGYLQLEAQVADRWEKVVLPDVSHPNGVENGIRHLLVFGGDRLFINGQYLEDIRYVFTNGLSSIKVSLIGL
jgi:hypothetical protein